MAKRKLTPVEGIGLALAIVALALFFVPSAQEVLKRWGLHVVVAWLILTLGAALLEFLSGRSWKRIGIVTLIIAVASGAVLVATSRPVQGQTIPDEKKSDTKDTAFLIRQKGAVLFSDYPQPLLYEYGANDDLAPIALSVGVEVTNNRATKTKIIQYAADIQMPNGSWHRLLSLPMSPPHTIYFLNLRDIRRGMRCQFDPGPFDPIADRRILDLGESIEGEMFFELPPELRRLTVTMEKLRITIKNVQGETADKVFDSNTPPSQESGASELDNGSLFCRGKRGEAIDLSDRTIRPFRD